jgi:hypothetical protein
MVYNTQNYWVFGLCPSSGIPKNTEHNIGKLYLFPSSRVGWETPSILGPLAPGSFADKELHVNLNFLDVQYSRFGVARIYLDMFVCHLKLLYQIQTLIQQRIISHNAHAR